MAYMVAPQCRPALAGVINVDGSCRPQIVPEAATGPFADLLRAGRRHWGIGAVLNTSLNIHGEPLVQTPAQAVSVLLRSQADTLVLGRSMLETGMSGSRSER
jgi:carbamoyltransferase